MKLRNRFLLVIFGLLVFIIVTPLLVLFTSGYQIDWSQRKIVKTGSLVAKTLPSKATIYINNKKAEGTTPETIRFLLPADYDIRVEKDGYQSWTKRLPIHQQLATWANFNRDFITLFYKSGQQIQTIPINFSSLSKTGGEIAYIQNSQLNLYNVDNQSTQNLGDVSDQIVPFTFVNSLTWTNGAKVLQYFTTHSSNLPFDVKSIKKTETNGDQIVILVNNELYTLKDSTLVLVDKEVAGFALEGENIWYTQDTSLKQYNLRTYTPSVVWTNIPVSATSQIIRGEGNTFLLLDKSLCVLNDTLEKIYDGATYANYDSASHALLFSNSNEILLYRPQQKSSELILRSISPVSHPFINTYSGYVFFVNENKIKAIELDGRDHRNVYTIVDSIPSDANFIVTNDASVLTVFNSTNLTSYRIR